MSIWYSLNSCNCYDNSPFTCDLCIIVFVSHSFEYSWRKQASAWTCRCFDQSLTIQWSVLNRQVENCHHCKIPGSGATSASVLRQVPCGFEDDLENYVSPQSSSSNAFGFNIKLQECQKSSRVGSLAASCRSRIIFCFRAVPTSFIGFDSNRTSWWQHKSILPCCKNPASIVIDRMENSTKVDETVGIPDE
jgi:hypothetical protein